MTRREAIRNIALAAAATAFLPACSELKVTEQILAGQLKLDYRHMNYLASISETFLPVSGISDKLPEAAGFIVKMLNDCHPLEEILDFAEGFEQFKKLLDDAKLSIQDPNPKSIITVVEDVLEVEDPELKLVFFITNVAERSIQNLVTSEFYQTEYAEYQLIPPRYVACSPGPVNSSK